MLKTKYELSKEEVILVKHALDYCYHRTISHGKDIWGTSGVGIEDLRNNLEVKPIIGTATWSLVEDPLLHITCPHCSNTIIASKPKTIELFINWAKKLKI